MIFEPSLGHGGHGQEILRIMSASTADGLATPQALAPSTPESEQHDEDSAESDQDGDLALESETYRKL